MALFVRLFRLTFAALLFASYLHGSTTAVGVYAIVLALSLRPVRAMVRYTAAYAGLVLIRAYVVHQARPYAGQLPHPGAVSDPDAQWRQWLATV